MFFLTKYEKNRWVENFRMNKDYLFTIVKDI